MTEELNLKEAYRRVSELRANIQRVFVGEERVVTHLLVGLLAGGHVLIEDVPGVGKTTLARALATSIDCEFRRIQFTPDLLPADILGVSLYDPGRSEFTFKPGPVFANVLLADEVNRTPPRTQSALLEAMSEQQVSVDGETRSLPEPFMVLATMNPVESHGTYDLPENQLDRFLLRLQIGYPDIAGERRIFRAQARAHPLDALTPVVSGDEIRTIQELVRGITVDESLEEYVLNLVHQSRRHADLLAGASPRSTLMLFRAAQSRAFLGGRAYVIPDDIKELVIPVLGHRLLARVPGEDRAATVLKELMSRIAVPS